MSSQNRHPDRVEMLEAIRSGTVPFASHLAQCEACRQLFELLSACSAVRGRSESVPIADAVYRHIAIPRLIQSRHPDRLVTGEVVFDSWSSLPAVQVRDAVYDGERRLRLKADQYVLEFIADRQLQLWNFVARVYDRNRVTSEFILQIGRKKLFTRAQQCYFWSAKHPPKKVQLLSPSVRIDFGAITW